MKHIYFIILNTCFNNKLYKRGLQKLYYLYHKLYRLYILLLYILFMYNVLFNI